MRIGIIGTGRIAQRFMDTALQNLDVKVVCVYNPHIDSAQKFADRNNIDVYTDDIDELSELIEAVYIASPHETHYEYTKYMLMQGIHVLCEKPMALKRSEAHELFELAQQKQLVLKEAVKTAYCPGFNELLNIAQSGRIGRIVDVEAAFTRLTYINTREYENPVYNGSMLEFGSYGLLPVVKLMGTDIRDVQFKSVRAENGADIYTKAELTFSDGMATVKTGLGVKSEGQLLISGTKGYILAESPWWMTKKFVVRYEDSSRIEQYNYPYESSGLQYELAIFVYEIIKKREHDISDNLKNTDESPLDTASESGVLSIGIMPDESIAMAGVMESFLEWNTPLWKKKNDEFLKHAETLDRPFIWAHRGCSMKYPENTLEAFEAAAKIQGIKGIELDVQFTKDKQIVVFNDENVSRVTDGDKKVCEYTLEELKQLNVCEQGIRIPTLQEVLDCLRPYCEKNGLLINIELKTSVIRYEGIETATHKLVKDNKMEKYIVYSSFLPESVAMMKDIAPECETGMLDVSLEECIKKARQTGAEALHPYIGAMDCKIPDDMMGKNIRAWNFNEPFYKDGRELRDVHFDRFKAYGVTDVITNVPELYLNIK